MRVIVEGNASCLTENCIAATTMGGRVLGWMFKRRPEQDEAIWLNPCNGIHTCFMRYPIDVVFLDADNHVIYLISAMKSWRMSPIIKDAKSVLELLPGCINQHDLKIGMRLIFR